MTTDINTVGAGSHKTINWQTINWKKVNRNVRRLQARIVKAQQEGNTGKAPALQWILTHSPPFGHLKAPKRGVSR